jgi:sugar phosphate isomerase/epimerase
MKLSVFTVVTPDLSPEELVDTAKDTGLDGVEWRFKETPEEVKQEEPSFWGNNLCTIDPNLAPEQMVRFKELTESRGLEIASVTPYLNALNLEETEHVFSTAKLLGAKMIRVGSAGYNGTESYTELFDKTSKYIKEAERMAKQYGVKGIVETHHKTITPSAGLAHRLVSQCDPDHIGVLFDPGNMVHEGFEDFKMGMELLGPYLAHVHVKNAHWKSSGKRGDGTLEWNSEWAPMTEGIVNFTEVFNYLKSVGYDGYLGIEDFSKQYKSKELLQQYAAFVKERL